MAAWPDREGWPQVAVAEQQGGVVAVIGSPSREALSLWKVDPCGEESWGGGIVLDTLRSESDGDPLPVHDVAVAPAPDGGAFVVRRVESGHESEDTYVQRYDSRGQPQWQPEDRGVYIGDCDLHCYDAPEANLAARSDGSGGVWIVDKIQVDVEIQHVDARGRPLYHLKRWKCADDDRTVRAEIQAVERDGGAAGLDAGVPVDASCPPPDGGMDAGLDAGIDAPGDAATDAAADGAADAEAG